MEREDCTASSPAGGGRCSREARRGLQPPGAVHSAQLKAEAGREQEHPASGTAGDVPTTAEQRVLCHALAGGRLSCLYREEEKRALLRPIPRTKKLVCSPVNAASRRKPLSAFSAHRLTDPKFWCHLMGGSHVWFWDGRRFVPEGGADSAVIASPPPPLPSQSPKRCCPPVHRLLCRSPGQCQHSMVGLRKRGWVQAPPTDLTTQEAVIGSWKPPQPTCPHSQNGLMGTHLDYE